MTDFDVTLPFVPDISVGEFPDTTQTHTKTFTGLPVGAKGMLVDNLFRVFSKHGLQNEAAIIHAFVVPEDGTITLSDLRDSVYTLFFSTPGYAKYNQYGISVGDPEKFNEINRFTNPSPPVITSVESALDDEVPFAKVIWKLGARGQTGLFRVDYKLSSTSTWSTFEDQISSNVRNIVVTPLEYGSTYNFRVAVKTKSGNVRGYSNTENVVTPDAPLVELPSNTVVVDGGFIEQFDGTAVEADNIYYNGAGATLESLKPAEVGATVTNAANVNAAGAVMESDYGTQTILASNAPGVVAQVTVAINELVGRKAVGDIVALTKGETQTVLNVADGADVTATNNNWSEVNDDDGKKPDDNADVTVLNTAADTTLVSGTLAASVEGGAMTNRQIWADSAVTGGSGDAVFVPQSLTAAAFRIIWTFGYAYGYGDNTLRAYFEAYSSVGAGGVSQAKLEIFARAGGGALGTQSINVQDAGYTEREINLDLSALSLTEHVSYIVTISIIGAVAETCYIKRPVCYARKE